jgi:hypothetical protein
LKPLLVEVILTRGAVAPIRVSSRAGSWTCRVPSHGCWLGAANRHRLHLKGMDYLWGSFMITNARRIPQSGACAVPVAMRGWPRTQTIRY